MLTVHMAGLMYFHGCSIDDKKALLPDGRGGSGKIPPHYASIWVEHDQLDDDDWWPGEKYTHDVIVEDEQGNEIEVQIHEFRIAEPAVVRFPDEGKDPARFVNLESTLPKLQEIDKSFEIDLDTPATIATIPIRGGSLTTYLFGEVGIVQWTIPDSRAMVIEAEAGKNTWTISLKRDSGRFGTEIVVANTSDLLGKPEKDEDNHFALYGRLERRRRHGGLTPPEEIDVEDPLPFDHDYLKTLVHGGNELPAPGCTPTCCS